MDTLGILLFVVIGALLGRWFLRLEIARPSDSDNPEVQLDPEVARKVVRAHERMDRYTELTERYGEHAHLGLWVVAAVVGIALGLSGYWTGLLIAAFSVSFLLYVLRQRKRGD